MHKISQLNLCTILTASFFLNLTFVRSSYIINVSKVPGCLSGTDTLWRTPQ